MSEKITYTSLLDDDLFLRDAYKSLRAQGINVSTKAGDILDRFLTNKRYFDTNVASTFVIGDEVKDMSPENQQSYARAVTKIEQLPTIGSQGAAPTSKLIKDYLVAGVTDPTNLLSILAGAFTFGAGGAAVQAGKETAKQGVKKLVKTKIKNIAGQDRLRQIGRTTAALGVEGGVAALGGGAQALKAQDVDMAIGRRKKGDFDFAQAGQQAALEGIISPVAGFGLAKLGSLGTTAVKEGAKISAKGLEKTGLGRVALKQGEALAQHINYLKNFLLPQGGLDTITARNFEIGEAAFKTIKQETEKVVDDLEIAQSSFIKSERDLDLVNDAMEGDTAALNEIRTGIRKTLSGEFPSKKDVKLADAISNFIDLRRRVYNDVFTNTDGQSKKLKDIYKIDPVKYTKKIYTRPELFQGFRMPKEYWKKYEVNQKFLNELKTKARQDPNLQVQLGIREGIIDKDTGAVLEVGKIKDSFYKEREGVKEFQRAKLDDYVEQEIYESFYPKKGPAKLGGLKRRKEIDPILQKIWGVNYSPAVRAAETIGAITEPLADIRIANQIGNSLLGRGLAVVAPDDAAARNALQGQDVVPLVGGLGDDVGIRIRRSDIFDPKLGQIYVPRELGEKIRILTQREGVLNDTLMGSLFSGINGYLKKGKTVYNPFGHVRNIMGVPQYVANSGNFKGVGKYAQLWKTSNKEQKQKLTELANRLGVTASNVEINQILGRLAEARNLQGRKSFGGWMSRRLLDLSSGFMSNIERTKLGKRFARAAEKTYTGTDDIGKIMTFTSERDRAQAIWDNMTPDEKQLRREEFSKGFGVELPKVKQPTSRQIETMMKQAERGKFTLRDKFNANYKKDLDKFDSDLLWEEAAQKTLDVIPVYSRIPKVFEYMRDIPIVGAFTAFPAENLRNKYKILKLGAEEIKNGFKNNNFSLIKAGKNRLLSQTLMAAAPTISAYMYNQVMGTSDMESGVRKMMPEWSRYHALQIRPKGKDAEGNETYGVTDLSYANPDQYVLDVIAPLMIAAANGEDVTAQLDDLFPYIAKKTFEPFLSPSLATDLGFSILDYAKSDTEEGSARALAKTYKILEPGILKLLTDVAGEAGANDAIDKLSASLGGEGAIGSDIRRALRPLYFGDKRSYLKDASSLADYFSELGVRPTGEESPLSLLLYPFRLGIKEQDYKPKKQLGFAVSNLMRNANGTVNSKSRKIKDILIDPDDNTSLNSMLKDYQEAIEEQFAAQQGVYEMVMDLKQFMSTEQVRSLLRDKKIKTAGGFSNVEIENILNGTFTAPRLDVKFFRDLGKRNPSIRKYVPTIRNSFNKLTNMYMGKPLQTEELPDIIIGD